MASLVIDGQFELSRDVTKFMWRSSLNKIREIRFPKDALVDFFRICLGKIDFSLEKVDFS